MLFRQFSETVLYYSSDEPEKNDCKVQMVFSYSRNFRCTMLAHLPKTATFSEVSHGTQWYSVCFWMQFRRKASHSAFRRLQYCKRWKAGRGTGCEANGDLQLGWKVQCKGGILTSLFFQSCAQCNLKVRACSFFTLSH